VSWVKVLHPQNPGLVPGFVFEFKSKPPMSVREVYEEELQKRAYQSDPAQLRAIEALERCASEWAAYQSKRSGLLGKLFSRPEIPKGVYMFGGWGEVKAF
jgi:cell division protein ZapE